MNFACLNHVAKLFERDELIHKYFGSEQTGHFTGICYLYPHHGGEGPQQVGTDQLW